MSEFTDSTHIVRSPADDDDDVSFSSLPSTYVVSGNISSSARTPSSIMIYAYIWAAIVLPLLACGAIGNLLTVISVIVFKRLRSGSGVLVANLSVIDLIGSSVVYPFSVASIVAGGYNSVISGSGESSHDRLCKIIGYFYICTALSSTLGCCAIAINRFVAVILPDFYERATSRPVQALMILANHAVPYGIMSFALRGKGGQLGRLPPWQWCCFDHQRSTRLFQLLALTIHVVAPTILMSIIYFTIYLKVRFVRRNIRQTRLPPSPRPGDATTMPLPSFCQLHSSASNNQSPASFLRRIVSASSLIGYPSSPVPTATPVHTAAVAVDTNASSPTHATKAALACCCINIKRYLLFKKRVRATKMMFYTYVAFVVSYCPVVWFFIWAKNDFEAWPRPVLQLVVLGIYWCATLVNPIIYAVMNPDYRDAYGFLIRKFILRQSAERNPAPFASTAPYQRIASNPNLAGNNSGKRESVDGKITADNKSSRRHRRRRSSRQKSSVATAEVDGENHHQPQKTGVTNKRTIEPHKKASRNAAQNGPIKICVSNYDPNGQQQEPRLLFSTTHIDDLFDEEIRYFNDSPLPGKRKCSDPTSSHFRRISASEVNLRQHHQQRWSLESAKPPLLLLLPPTQHHHHQHAQASGSRRQHLVDNRFYYRRYHSHCSNSATASPVPVGFQLGGGRARSTDGVRGGLNEAGCAEEEYDEEEASPCGTDTGMGSSASSIFDK